MSKGMHVHAKPGSKQWESVRFNQKSTRTNTCGHTSGFRCPYLSDVFTMCSSVFSLKPHRFPLFSNQDSPSELAQLGETWQIPCPGCRGEAR